MAFPFSEENQASRQRLVALASRLSDQELVRANAHGWTVAALLAHIAFWDQRILVLLRRWQAHGVDESPVDPDMINDALHPLLLALEPRTAVRLCLATAEAVDTALEGITDELMAEIEASPNHFRLNRSLHRDDHLQEIERLLQEAGR
jgi:uncharacterized damage-inducible protein DinB